MLFVLATSHSIVIADKDLMYYSIFSYQLSKLFFFFHMLMENHTFTSAASGPFPPGCSLLHSAKITFKISFLKALFLFAMSDAKCHLS